MSTTAKIVKVSETTARTVWAVSLAGRGEYQVHTYPQSRLLYVEKAGRQVRGRVIEASIRAAIPAVGE